MKNTVITSTKKGGRYSGRFFLTSSLKNAVLLLVLSVLFPCKSPADFSTNALIGYLTGIPALSDYMTGSTSGQEHPAGLAEDISPYVSFAGNNQSVYRNFTGEKKRIGHSLMTLGVNYPIVKNTAGAYLSYTGNRSTLTWPFSNNRINVGESYNDQAAAITGYTKVFDHLRAGITTGKHIGNRGNSLLFIAEVSTYGFKKLNGSVRYYTKPYEWNLGIDYDTVTKNLPASFRSKGLEGSMSYVISDQLNVTLSGEKSGIDTPQDFPETKDQHAQSWKMDHRKWNVLATSSHIDGITLNGSYGEDVLSGDLGLFYNSDRYMKGSLEGLVRRIQLGGQLTNGRRFIPALRYDRVSTELLLSDGVADSWPFTPKQIEIFGDKTWSFSGTGILTSDSGTFIWNLPPRSRLMLSYVRAHVDYNLRITTRDHLSANLFDMLFGRRRNETDTTQYYDFANLSYMRNFTFGRFSIELGISQLIPLYHKEKKVPGIAPEPPSFPELKLKKPENFGGFSFEFAGKWKY
ncbi:hypothetical protein ACFL6K_03050 [Candidatus Latescibacterota bacterium]